MDSVNIHEAKTQLSRLLERVERGEEIVIARNGRPIARIVPMKALARRPGMYKGQIRIHPDFDAPLDTEFERPFSG
jgi:prevent-host-death family protein